MEDNGVMDGIISLAETVLEGLEFLQSRLESGHARDSIYLLEDVQAAVVSIGNALEKGLPGVEVDLSGLEPAPLEDELDRMWQLYKQDNVNEAQLEMKARLLPEARRWKRELEKCFEPLRLA